MDIQRTFELLKAGSLMVIGAAGAGKTTLLRELAMSSAKKLQDSRPKKRFRRRFSLFLRGFPYFSMFFLCFSLFFMDFRWF